ncbi:MAG TPA: hypothetical protein VJN95_14590 [Gemmatimonadales bacterium]|nr:hypothetical protein [Gemmatimonadales bacterium]
MNDGRAPTVLELLEERDQLRAEVARLRSALPSAGVTYVPVSPEFLEELKADWSRPVQCRIEGELGGEVMIVCRTLPEQVSV